MEFFIHLICNKYFDYFKSYKSTEKKIPHFLWNCKMRFGKTFATYKLAEKMKWSKILVLTFKPAVENSWYQDLINHVDFKNWQFVSRETDSYDKINKSKPFVCFASFQDLFAFDLLHTNQELDQAFQREQYKGHV